MNETPLEAGAESRKCLARLRNGEWVDANAAVRMLAALRGMAKFEPNRLSDLIVLASGKILPTEALQYEQSVTSAYVSKGRLNQLVEALLTTSEPRRSGKVFVLDDPFDRSEPTTLQNLEVVEAQMSGFTAKVLDATIPGRQSGRND